MAQLPDGGTILPITRWGAAVLHRRCQPVVRFDDDLARLVADMTATMRAADGVGLAANQVGVDLQVFVFDCTDPDTGTVRGVVCNPVLEVAEGKDRRLDEGEEGCLSLPGAFVRCVRPDWARVTGLDERGEPVTFEGAGLLARCLQHETDHTQGTVFGDRLPSKDRRVLVAEAEELADRYPDDWPVSPLRIDENA